MSRAGAAAQRRERERKPEPPRQQLEGDIGAWGYRRWEELVWLVETQDRMIAVRNRIISELREHLTAEHRQLLLGGKPTFPITDWHEGE